MPARLRTATAALNRRAPALSAVLGTLLVVGLFFAPAIGKDTFVYRDTGRLHAPDKRWIAEELRQGRFPQWNPYAGLGAPVVANAIDSPQHPFNLLLVLFPDQGLKLWILLCYGLAALGAMAWARTLALGWSSASVAGLAFALCGPLVSASDNVTYLTSYAVLPWVLAALQRWLAGGGAASLVGVAAAGALCAAGGDPQSWGIMVALFVPYALAFSPGRRLAAARRGLVAALATLVFSAPFVLPVVLWLPHSARAGGMFADELRRWNLHPHRLPEMLLPSLFRGEVNEPISAVFQAFCGNDLTPLPWFLSVYLGASALALCALGVAADRRIRWLALGGGVLLWAALGPNAGFGALASRIPVLNSLRFWEKLTIWPALMVALGAGAGAAAVLEREGGAALVRRWVGAIAVIAGLLLALSGVATLRPALLPGASAGPELHQALAANFQSAALQSGLVLALLALLAAASGRPRYRRLAPAVLTLLVAADLVGGNGGAYVLGAEPEGRPPLAEGLEPGARVLSPFAMRQDRWPERGRLASTWEWGLRTLMASWNVPLRVRTPSDYVGLKDARWTELQHLLTEDERLVPILGIFGFDRMVVPGDPRNSARAGFGDTLQVVDSDPELPAWLVSIPHRPRAYVAGAVRVARQEDVLGLITHSAVTGTEVTIEGPLPEGWPASSSGGTARVIEDMPSRVTVETATTGRALLVLNDSWATGWSATIDGSPTPILRANWAVRAVPVPPGAHSVRFRYQTPGLAEGWAVAIGGALVIGAWALLQARRRRVEGQS